MAEFQKVLEEKKRMCEHSICNKCPLGTFITNVTTCDRWMLKHPKEAEDYIMKWSAEHPLKTNGMKFKEVFGDYVVWESNEEMVAWLNAEYKGVQDEK